MKMSMAGQEICDLLRHMGSFYGKYILYICLLMLHLVLELHCSY